MQDILDYCSSVTSPESKALNYINRETHLKTLKPQMLGGHLQGKLLEMISIMLKPKRILEIGTFTAYSTVCLSAGLQEGGEIHTIEQNPELEGFIINNLQKANILDRINLHIGLALDVLPRLKGFFDLIYLDADHSKAPAYFRLLKPLLNKGAYLIVDNALWKNKVVYPEKQDDTESKAMSAFNKIISGDKDFDTLLLPFRDGIMFARKK